VNGAKFLGFNFVGRDEDDNVIIDAPMAGGEMKF